MPTVTILLLENLFLILAFEFLVKVSFPIPGLLSSFILLARDTPCLPSLSKRGGPTFPGTCPRGKDQFRAGPQEATWTRTNPIRGSSGGGLRTRGSPN